MEGINMLNQEEMGQLKTALALQEKMILNSVSEQEVERVTFSERFERKMKRLFIRSEKIYYPMINTVLKRVACFALATIMLTSLVGAGVYALIRQRNARVIAPYFISESALYERIYTNAQGEYVLLTYLKSEDTAAGVLDWYRDKARNEYAFDEMGNLISISFSDKALKQESTGFTGPITEKQAKIFAQQYAKTICGEEFSLFEFNNVLYDSDENNYTIEYCVMYADKYVGELCIVTVGSDGSLEHITRPLQSQLKGFDPALLESVGDEALNEFIDQDVHRQFVEGSFTYTVNKLAIREQNEQLGIMAFVTVYPSDGTGSTGVEVFYPLES